MKRKRDALNGTKKCTNDLDSDTFSVVTAERCNFHLHPELSVQAMAYSSKTRRLCVLRRMDINKKYGESSKFDLVQNVLTFVEFYNASNPPLIFLEKSIPLFDALDSLVWIDSWAIFGALSGKLYLFSPFTSRFRRLQLCASEIICMAQLDENKFVIINNSGDLLILNKISENNEKENNFPEFLTNKITKFSSNEHVLCMACTMKKTQPLISIGMVNRIKLITINVKDKIEERIIAVPRIKTNATMICSLVFMEEFLFAGDSHGQITIYESDSGSLLKILKSHQAHILALATNGKEVFASGADYRIQVISRINHDQNKFDWQQVGQRLFHMNDVRTLCVLNKKWLLSGGYEGFYISRKYMFCKPQQRPECSYSKERGILLSSHLTNAYLWYKPPIDSRLLLNSNKISTKYSSCQTTPKLLVQIVGGSMGFIKQACISPNGKYACFAGNVKGMVSIIHIDNDIFENFVKTTKNNDGFTQNQKLIKRYWTNHNSHQVEIGGKTVSAMFCTDEHLYYATGEYTIIQFNFLTKQQEIIANEINPGHLIKICTNPSETLLLALAANSTVMFFDIDKTKQTKTRNILSLNEKIPYEGLFINEECIILICTDLKAHLMCYDLQSNQKLIENSAKQMGLCETEWIAYTTLIVPNQLLVTTNKGRVFIINIDLNQERFIIISEFDNSIRTEIDSRIEPFLGEYIGHEKIHPLHVILVGHLEENSYRQKPLRLRFFQGNS